MAQLLNPYLNFDGAARDALAFYQDALGGTVETSTYGEFGDMAGPTHADRIMHGRLSTPAGFTLMIADSPPGQELQHGNDVTISLSGDDGVQLRGYWQKLIVDGTVTVPLEKQMWGDEFGSCVDRFGISWLVNIAV